MLCLLLTGCIFLAPPVGTIRTVDREYTRRRVPHTDLTMRFFRNREFDEGVKCDAPWVWYYFRTVAWESHGIDVGFRERAAVLLSVCDMTVDEYRNHRRQYAATGLYSVVDVTPGVPFTEKMNESPTGKVRALARNLVVEATPSRLFIVEVRTYHDSLGQPPGQDLLDYTSQVAEDLFSSIRKAEEMEPDD
jgi:hypothetical protein